MNSDAIKPISAQEKQLWQSIMFVWVGTSISVGSLISGIKLAETLTLISGVLMTLTAMYGIKAMKYLNYVAVPFMVFVILWATINAFLDNDIYPKALVG